MKKLPERKQKNKMLYHLTPVMLAVMSMQAHGMIDNNSISSIKAHSLYHIKSNTLSAFASGFSPTQIRHAYGFDKIVNQGEGQTIGIVDAYDNPNAGSDLNVFSSAFGLPACTTANGCFKVLYSNGSQPAGDWDWGVQISLDVQWAHAIAPKANILLVESADSTYTNLLKAINLAVSQGASVITMSWGSQEFSGQTQFDSTFNVPGVEFIAPSGDAGTGVIYPSVAPHVIAVGGTTLHIDSSGNYASETAWSGSGGGFSQYESEPAYQINFPIPSDTNNHRGAPDISYNADPATGVSIYDSYGNYGWITIGGTSAGTSQIAAMIAIAKSATTQHLTGISAMLYNLGKKDYSTLYHDITSGSNGACGYLCTAQTGYDYVTGLGSPVGDKLISAITGTSPPPPPPDDRIPI